MNTVIQSVPETVGEHLKEAAVRFGLDDSLDTKASLEQCWLEKMGVFEEEMIERGMDEVGDFDPLDERGALFLTYSGSLLSIGPLVGGEREIAYTSIGLRKDVPASLELSHAVMAEIAETGKPVSFKEGPLKQTSPLFKIVVPPLSLDAEEQTCLIEDAVTVISEKFAELNGDMMN